MLAITTPLALVSGVVTQAGQTVAPVQVAQAETTYVCLPNRPGYPAKYHRVCLPR